MVNTVRVQQVGHVPGEVGTQDDTPHMEVQVKSMLQLHSFYLVQKHFVFGENEQVLDINLHCKDLQVYLEHCHRVVYLRVPDYQLALTAVLELSFLRAVSIITNSFLMVLHES